MPLDRTWYTSLVDDDGSGTVGSVWNKASVDHIYDDVDVAIVDSLQPVKTEVASTADWVPGINGHTLTRWAGAADFSVHGISGGLTAGSPGIAGTRWTFRNVGSAVAYFYHLSGSATAGHAFSNVATSGLTPVAAGGSATWEFDGSVWLLVAHEQGAWITPAYSAADYSAAAGTWTVEAGDVIECRYRLTGRTLMVKLWVLATSVSAATGDLRRAVPGGFTLAGNDAITAIQVNNAGGGATIGYATSGPGNTALAFYSSIGGGSWTAATNNTSINGKVIYEVI